MCDIQNNGKIQREFETRSTDDQPTIQWLPVVGSWTFLGVNMHFNEKLFMCDSCNFLVRAYHLGNNNNYDVSRFVSPSIVLNRCHSLNLGPNIFAQASPAPTWRGCVLGGPAPRCSSSWP